MTHLIILAIYLAGFFVGTAVGARVFYGIERRANQEGKVIAAYQLAVLEGAVAGLLWPISLPLLLLFGVGWQAARIAAPQEVRAEVSAYNTAMMERVLGIKGAEFERRHAIEQPEKLGRCGLCYWQPDGTLRVYPGCPIHDNNHIILNSSER